MLLFWVDESAEATADEDAAMMIAVKSWVEGMTERGVSRSGGALRSAGEAKIVRVRDGEVLVSDGPFAETKEQIGGYDVVECPDLDAALGSRPGIRWRERPRSRCGPSGTRPGTGSPAAVFRSTGQAATSRMPSAARARPRRWTQRSRSPSTTRASSTVTPGYSEASTTARPNAPVRVAAT